jgi:hypothetical protein
MGEELVFTAIAGDGFRVVKEFARREHVPAYDRIGGNMEYRSPIKGYEGLYKTFGQLSKMANWLLWELVEKRNSTTNIAVFKASSQLESKNITIAYKELFSAELVCRVQRQRYLLNPMAFIPKPNHYKDVLEYWEKTISEAKQKSKEYKSE